MNATRAAVLTVSDGVAGGTRVDESGDVAVQLLDGAGFIVSDRRVVPDEQQDIESALRDLASTHGLVVTTGGTGFGPRDVTPEATRAVIEREAPGLAELMRATGLAHTPMAALSRAVAGAVGGALILNLPGSPRGVRESLESVLSLIPHAVELLGGAAGGHPTGHRGDDGAHALAEAPRTGSPRTRWPKEPWPKEMWVEAKAVRITGSPPCAVGNAMSIVPGGEVHGTLGCAEFDAAAVQAA
ncbi:MAG: MogA/MoaB family molybdenum cofactor biosynthesis protein, partial [Actinobacteria bacterium]|nr:MogA/MoaB family molybdenum cofactor biosynthesis protein [Actinomycetota bacterium]